jgi:hypothetical protein
MKTVCNAPSLLQAALFKPSLVAMATRGIKSPPHFNKEEDANKINSFNGDLAAYFEDLMHRRPKSASGYISLPKENFRLMVSRAQSERDCQTLLNTVLVNYIGHRNILPHAYVDGMALRALELGHPESMLELFRLHKELLYHPSTAVLAKYAAHFEAQGGLEKLLAFYQVVRGNYLLQLPQGFHGSLILKASQAGDQKTVIKVYLDILDYGGLTREHLTAVYEALDYDSYIDVGLVQHLGTLGQQGDPTIKLH